MKIQSLKDVEKAVEEIERLAHDPERAHELEDDLYQAVLQYIADGGWNQAQEIAYAALGTKEIEFARWCA